MCILREETIPWKASLCHRESPTYRVMSGWGSIYAAETQLPSAYRPKGQRFRHVFSEGNQAPIYVRALILLSDSLPAEDLMFLYKDPNFFG